MTNYVPREGDTVRVELTVQVTPQGESYLVDIGNGAIALDNLIKAGKVELVARAEPDWQPGDIGQHVETGARYMRCEFPIDRPWLQVTGEVSRIGQWQHHDFLAGKLVRCTVTPEDGIAPTVPGMTHEHFCAMDGGHTWPCEDRRHLRGTHGGRFTCPDHLA